MGRHSAINSTPKPVIAPQPRATGAHAKAELDPSAEAITVPIARPTAGGPATRPLPARDANLVGAADVAFVPAAGGFVPMHTTPIDEPHPRAGQSTFASERTPQNPPTLIAPRPTQAEEGSSARSFGSLNRFQQGVAIFAASAAVAGGVAAAIWGATPDSTEGATLDGGATGAPTTSQMQPAPDESTSTPIDGGQSGGTQQGGGTGSSSGSTGTGSTGGGQSTGGGIVQGPGFPGLGGIGAGRDPVSDGSNFTPSTPSRNPAPPATTSAAKPTTTAKQPSATTAPSDSAQPTLAPSISPSMTASSTAGILTPPTSPTTSPIATPIEQP